MAASFCGHVKKRVNSHVVISHPRKIFLSVDDFNGSSFFLCTLDACRLTNDRMPTWTSSTSFYFSLPIRFRREAIQMCCVCPQGPFLRQYYARWPFATRIFFFFFSLKKRNRGRQRTWHLFSKEQRLLVLLYRYASPTSGTCCWCCCISFSPSTHSSRPTRPGCINSVDDLKEIPQIVWNLGSSTPFFLVENLFMRNHYSNEMLPRRWWGTNVTMHHREIPFRQPYLLAKQEGLGKKQKRKESQN